MVERTLDRLLDVPLPAKRGDPRAAMRRRVVVGAALIGLAVALVSLAMALATGGVGAAPVLVFAVGCVAILVLSRAGASTTILRVLAMLLVCAFLGVQSLQTVEVDWAQFKWLALLPLITLYLWDPSPVPDGDRRRLGPLWLGSLLAVTMAVAIVLAHQLGWTAQVTQAAPTSPAEIVASLADLVLFIASFAGLTALHQRSLRKANEEVALLRSLLAMCAWCRRIRDDEDWISVERYIAKRESQQLTHGICPECAEKAMASLD